MQAKYFAKHIHDLLFNEVSSTNITDLITNMLQVKMYIQNSEHAMYMWFFVPYETIGINQASKLICYAICRVEYSIHYKMRVIPSDKPQPKRKKKSKQ